MITIILSFVTLIWIVGGGIMAAIFYCEQILPAKSLYKNIVGIIACGPGAWITMLFILYARKLRAWLKD